MVNKKFFAALTLISLISFAANSARAQNTCAPEERDYLPRYDRITDEASLNDASAKKNALSGPRYSNLTFPAGITGEGVAIRDGSFLALPTPRFIDRRKGKISFHFKPDWNALEIGSTRYLIDASPGFRVAIWRHESGKSYFVFRYDGNVGPNATPIEVSTSRLEPAGGGDGNQGIVSKWKAGEWHHIEVSWDLRDENSQYIKFTVDGVTTEKNIGRWSAYDFPCEFAIGSRLNGANPAAGVFDEIRFFGDPDVELHSTLNDADTVLAWRGNLSPGVSFVNGTAGKSANISPGQSLTLPSLGNLSKNKGSISFFYRPDGSETNPNQEVLLLDAGALRISARGPLDKRSFRFELFDSNGNRYELNSDSDPALKRSAEPWYHVQVAWNMTAGGQNFITSVIDRVSKTISLPSGVVAQPSELINISPSGLLDELVISSSSNGLDAIGLSFSQSFENLQSLGVNPSLTANDLVPGKSGLGVNIKAGKLIRFPAAGAIDPLKGTISFDFQPNWTAAPESTSMLFTWSTAENPTNFRVEVHNDRSGKDPYFVFIYNSGSRQLQITDSREIVSKWRVGEWHNIMIFWDLTTSDGNYIGYALDRKHIKTLYDSWPGGVSFPDHFYIGNNQANYQPANGIVDNLQIYNHSFLDKLSPIEAYTNLTRNNGSWEPHETIHDSPKDSPVFETSDEFLFFKRPAFDAVVPGSVPQPDQLVNNWPATIAKGELETLFVNLYSTVHLDGATFEVSELHGPGGKSLGKPTIKLVKPWWQAGIYETREVFPVYTPELLIGDDTSGDGVKLSGYKLIKNSGWKSQSLPSFPVLEYAKTNLKAFTSTQLAVTIKSPYSAIAGLYKGQVRLRDSRGITLKTLELDIEVLPFELRDSGKDYLIYNNAYLIDEVPEDRRSETQNIVSRDMYKKYAEDMAAHGVNGMAIYVYAIQQNVAYSSPVFQADKLDIARAAGLAGKNHFYGITPSAPDDSYRVQIRDIMLARGSEPLFSGIDEPNNFQRIGWQIDLANDVNRIGGKVITAIEKSWSRKLEDCNDPIYDLVPRRPCAPLDYANLLINPGSITRADAYIQQLANGGSPDTARSELYYWQSMAENPVINRSLAGFFLWNTKLKGVYPYVYQDVRNNPYDDWDEWAKSYSARDGLTTYPSLEGPVGTVQWEAFREGVDDVRYLQTWQHYQNGAKNAFPDAAEASAAKVATLLNQFRDFKGLWSMPAATFAESRQVLTEEILKMKTLLSATENGFRLVPAKIEAESFSRASPEDNINEGDATCTVAAHPGVDIQVTTDVGGGCNIGWTQPDEWLDYDIFVPEAGQYELILRASTAVNDRYLYLEVDGVQTGGQISIMNRGDWQLFSDHKVYLNLTSGPHTLRIRFGNGYVNLNYLHINRASAPVLRTPVPVPATIAATAFSAFQEATAQFYGDSACGTAPVDAEITLGSDGSCHLGYTTSGEWTEYQIDVAAQRDYDIVLSLATAENQKAVRLLINGESQAPITVANHGWQSFRPYTTRVRLPVGRHTLRVVYSTGNVNMKSVQIN